MSLSSWLKRPRKHTNEETNVKRLYLEERYFSARHVDLERLRDISALPRLVDTNEWLATNCLGFFNQVNECYGVMAEFCTQTVCPMMTAGSTQYQWQDDKGKKSKLAAPRYIDLVMSSMEKIIKDDSVFPNKLVGCFTGVSPNHITVDGSDFPPHFFSQVKKIFKFLFQVLAHIFHSHYQEVVDLDMHAHLNSLFAHFLIFSENFQLLDQKDQAPMEDFVTAIYQQIGSSGASATATR